MSLQDEIKKRRTFAIISHPDAGKTTITEQLLFFGGELREAGTVKGKKTGNFAKSDWMDIEKQRGISVTSSVMQFDYAGKRVNILDTPGHEDFSEDTYRVQLLKLSRSYSLSFLWLGKVVSPLYVITSFYQINNSNGFSSKFFKSTMNLAPFIPSTIRWSMVKQRAMIGRILISPSMTTGV